jgi:hypothetical protein
LDDAAAATPDIDEPPADDPARSKPSTETPRLFAGKYKTVEEFESAYQSAEQKITELSTKPAPVAPPPADEWVELSEEQLGTLKDTDPEAHVWYLTERENRKLSGEIEKHIKPLRDAMAPLTELEQKAKVQEFQLGEQNIQAQTKEALGRDFESLDKQRQNPEFLQKVLGETPQPLVDAILFHHEKGSPAYAQQLLLGAIQTHNLKINRGKAGRSIPADPGTGGGGGRTKDTAADLDEAGSLAAAELGMK